VENIAPLADISPVVQRVKSTFPNMPQIRADKGSIAGIRIEIEEMTK